MPRLETACLQTLRQALSDREQAVYKANRGVKPLLHIDSHYFQILITSSFRTHPV